MSILENVSLKNILSLDLIRSCHIRFSFVVVIKPAKTITRISMSKLLSSPILAAAPSCFIPESGLYFSSEFFWGNAGNRTRGCWVRSENATFVQHPMVNKSLSARVYSGLKSFQLAEKSLRKQSIKMFRQVDDVTCFD